MPSSFLPVFLGILAVLLVGGVVWLNVLQARARKAMTPEQRAKAERELDETMRVW